MKTTKINLGSLFKRYPAKDNEDDGRHFKAYSYKNSDIIIIKAIDNENIYMTIEKIDNKGQVEDLWESEFDVMDRDNWNEDKQEFIAFVEKCYQEYYN